MKIAFLTDSHFGDPTALNHKIDPVKNLQTVLQDITHKNIHKIILGGDIGAFNTYTAFFKMLQNFSYDLVLGNHDEIKEVAPFYKKAEEREELFYSDEDAYFRYIYLDSSSTRISKRQLEWLHQQLNTEKSILIFVHHPVIGFDVTMDREYPLKNREEVLSVLAESNKATHLFCGHYHTNDERHLNNIHQYCTQALSFQVAEHTSKIEVLNMNFGYRIIELEQGTIKTKLRQFTQFS